VLPTVGIEEIFLLLVLALLLFGPSKLPEMARSLGKGIRDFKQAMGSLDATTTPFPGHTDPYEPSASDEKL
jgi:sec-independent protein translocase protein TatA